MYKLLNLAITIVLLFTTACVQTESADNSNAIADPTRNDLVNGSNAAADITWNDLVPETFTLASILKKHNITVADVNKMKDSNPEEKKILDEIRDAYKKAPLRNELDGRKIRISGFVAPLETSELLTEFLLVPYFGACIHVPPPPINQIIFVRTDKGIPNDMYKPVQVTGTIKVEIISSELAASGYKMMTNEIVPVDVNRETGKRTHDQQ